MATNRSDWLPIAKSRICDMHFSVDDYESGDKSNMLKPNACPMISLNDVSKYNKYVINNYKNAQVYVFVYRLLMILSH